MKFTVRQFPEEGTVGKCGDAVHKEHFCVFHNSNVIHYLLKLGKSRNAVDFLAKRSSAPIFLQNKPVEQNS